MNSNALFTESFKSSPPDDSMAVKPSLKGNHIDYFVKHFKTNHFLAFKQKSMDPLFISTEQKRTPMNTLRRKYFGRKCRYISRSFQATRLSHFAKYLVDVTWTEKHSLKESFGVVTGYLLKNYITVKSLGDCVTIAQDVEFPRKYIWKLITLFSRTTSIRLKNLTTYSVKKWNRIPKYTKNLVKHINLELVKIKHSGKRQRNSLLGFDNLSSLGYRNGISSYSLSFNDIFPDLGQSKLLNTVYVDLTPNFDSAYAVDTLCARIETVNIEKWHIKTDIKMKEIMESKLDIILKKIDCLIINGNLLDAFVPKFIYTEYPDSLLSEHSVLQHMLEKRRKILELKITDTEEFDISQLLNRCCSLESLFLKTSNYKFKITEGSTTWATGLRDVILSLVSPSKSPITSLTFNTLLTKIKKESLNLETLELISGFIASAFDPKAMMATFHPTFTLQNPSISGIENLTSMQSLRLATAQDLTSLGGVLNQLPNLTKLEIISKCGNPVKVWDETLPFDSFSKLKELKLNKIVRTPQGWGKGFFNNLEYLKKLEVLEIRDSTEDEMSPDILKILIERFTTSLKDLRRFILNVNVRFGGIECLEHEQDKGTYSGKEGSIEEIKVMVLKFSDMNKSLEEMIVGKFTGFNFEWIRYQK